MLEEVIRGAAFVLVLFASGCWVGYTYRDIAVTKELAEVQQTAIERANVSGELAKQLALNQADQEAKHVAAIREAKYRSDLDAAKNNRPECARSGESMRVLNNLIDAGNSEGSTPATVFKSLWGNSKADRQFGVVNSTLGE